jgi:hypothetical protein
MGGPGRYDVLLNGRISSTCTMWGCMWSFGGRISIRPDIINFNTGRPGERTPEGELITRIVSFLQTKFGIGHDFPVTFEGGRDVTTSGLCSRALLP